MTDDEKIQEEFEQWWESDWMVGLGEPGKPLMLKPSVQVAFTAGYIRGQREAYMQMIADYAQAQGDYDYTNEDRYGPLGQG